MKKTFLIISIFTFFTATTAYGVETTEAVAALEQLSGEIYIQKEGSQEKTKAAPGTKLFPEDTVLSGSGKVTVVYPDGTSVASTYDARGRITEVVNQEGYATTTAYDDHLNVREITNAQGNTARMEFDPFGKLLKMQNV